MSFGFCPTRLWQKGKVRGRTVFAEGFSYVGNLVTQPPQDATAAGQSPTPSLPPIDPTAPPLIQTGLRAWLRRYRRFLPIPLCLLIVAGFRPYPPWGSPFLDTLTDVLGVCICALG